MAALAEREPRAVPQPSAPLPGVGGGAARPKGRWIAPVRFLVLIDGLALAAWACGLARRLRPARPSGRHPGGAPPVYRDETILLTLLVLRAWRWRRSPSGSRATRRVARALGMPAGRTISAAQLSRRGCQLGVWP